jgi:hypothetical protein
MQDTYEVEIYQVVSKRKTFRVKATDALEAKSEALVIARGDDWEGAEVTAEDVEMGEECRRI